MTWMDGSKTLIVIADRSDHERECKGRTPCTINHTPRPLSQRRQHAPRCWGRCWACSGSASCSPPQAPGWALVVSFGALITLYVVREQSPLNLGLLYLFATAEGVTLGLVLQSYLTRGLGGIVIDAAATTAAITLAAGAYGVTTRRDLAGLGGLLFAGLIGVLVAALLGLFIHLPLLQLGISIVATVLFTGFLAYDVNRVANTAVASTGDAIVLAVNIYLDIYNLFLNVLTILQVFGAGERE